jgi:hypothetical protein
VPALSSPRTFNIEPRAKGPQRNNYGVSDGLSV